MRVGEPVGLDTLEEPPERRGIGHIGGLCLTSMPPIPLRMSAITGPKRLGLLLLVLSSSSINKHCSVRMHSFLFRSLLLLFPLSLFQSASFPSSLRRTLSFSSSLCCAAHLCFSSSNFRSTSLRSLPPYVSPATLPISSNSIRTFSILCSACRRSSSSPCCFYVNFGCSASLRFSSAYPADKPDSRCRGYLLVICVNSPYP